MKNNIERFDGDFRFQLLKEEFDNLRCKNFISSWGGSRYLPLAFTEQGIYMLMAVLRGDLATKQSRALIRTFKQMLFMMRFTDKPRSQFGILKCPCCGKSLYGNIAKAHSKEKIGTAINTEDMEKEWETLSG